VERPWAIRIPYFDITLYEEAEDPDKHFTMKELKAQTREELLALVRARLAKSERFKDHALVFIHGYNTTFDNGIYRTAQIAYDLKFDGAPFHYSWPSGGGLSSYTYDRESAGQSIPYMRDFFDLVIKESGAKKISVIAHSMGNQPALQVMRDIKASSPPGVVISQIILAAPDVDRDNFENIAKEIQGLANGITLYAASNDFALNASRRFHGGIPRAGDVPPGGPLVLPGIDTIDVTAVSTDSLGLNHSGYAENNALLNDLQLLIQTGERPPEKRIPLLEKIGTAAGDYWRYPTAP
jgi:esterase/lipase superfamily enzyme